MGLKNEKKKRLTSRHFAMRDNERQSGYTPDLFAHPLGRPKKKRIAVICPNGKRLWAVYDDGSRHLMTPEEEDEWANEDSSKN